VRARALKLAELLSAEEAQPAVACAHTTPLQAEGKNQYYILYSLYQSIHLLLPDKMHDSEKHASTHRHIDT
jgi:hypothetical protein